MKKILAILLILTLALAVTGCKKDTPAADPEPTVGIEDTVEGAADEAAE